MPIQTVVRRLALLGCAIGLLAAALLFWMKRGIIVTLLACAALGLGLALLAP